VAADENDDDDGEGFAAKKKNINKRKVEQNEEFNSEKNLNLHSNTIFNDKNLWGFE
jgi:hypothetical protein